MKVLCRELGPTPSSLLSFLLQDSRNGQVPGPRPKGEAAHAGEGGGVVADVHLDDALAAVAEVGVAALDVLEEALHLLRLEFDLLRPLGNGEGLPARAGEEDVVGEGGLDEAAGHGQAGVLRTLHRTAGPERACEVPELFDFGRHIGQDCNYD